MKSNLEALMDGEMTCQQIIRDYITLVLGGGDKSPDENTIVDPELVELIIKDLKNGQSLPYRMCYYDREDNVIRNGIQFRIPDDEQHAAD